MVKKKEKESFLGIWDKMSGKSKVLLILFAVVIIIPLASPSIFIAFIAGFFDAIILLQLIVEVRKK